MTDAAPRNRLADETSPYLLQHAANPVDWYPWGPEALERARREDRPILLSIGYSACHWCHVMAHESFEDPAIARRMNEHFVCVKVDREERPDLDQIYQLAHQLLTRRGGGWPLTMFLTPGGKPFYGGTYFPREARFGLPGFPELLRELAAAWSNRRDSIEALGGHLAAALRQTDLRPPGADAAPLDDGPRRGFRAWLARSFDPVHGGTLGAPKFPQTVPLEFLLRHARRHPDDDEARRMLELTLDRMAAGGLHDQLGGGFFRYSTDERWRIPHFEKMLYDNALLLPVYADAWRLTGNEAYRRTAEDVADWALRELRLPGGAFASSLDADSAGGEGAFYVWTHDELRGLLDADELAAAEAAWDVSPHGNFEGANHLAWKATAAEAATRLGLPDAELERRLAAARTKLRTARERRPRPALDDKVLTAWNALMVRGLARAGRLLDRPDYIAAASAAVDFLRRELWHDGRLLAAWRADRARFPAYLDDHAFLLDALLELLQARWRSSDLLWAVALADRLLDSFADPAGGFYFTADDHETLLCRPHGAADGALPGGTGVAVRALLRLGGLLGRTDWLEAAERTLRTLAPELTRHAGAFGTLILALDEHLQPPRLVVLRGTTDALAPWHAALAADGDPRDLVFAIPPDAELPEALAAKSPRGAAVAYVCEGTHCEPPITNPARLPGTSLRIPG